ncbi:MAG: cyclic nucleotide-binding domain-containing protein [Anaerolineae bacterium]|nr:cyclic nucleotide-binding domain-containing protein [Anaerolineae bacterium]
MRDIPGRYLQFIVDCASEESFEAGEILFAEGADANRFYLILEGRVALGTQAEEQGFVTLQTLGDGDIVGWSWLLPPYHWHFGAKAIFPTRTITLNGNRLRQKSELDHEFGYELFKRLGSVIGQRLRMTRRQLQGF